MNVAQLRAKDRAAIGAHDTDTAWARNYGPVNVITGKAYGRMNRPLLTRAARKAAMSINRGDKHADEYSYTEYWGTYHQWSNLGAPVRKGETGTRIYYRARYFVLFSAEQVDLPAEYGDELAPVIDDIIRVNDERAESQRDTTKDERDTYRWRKVLDATAIDATPF